MNAQFFIGWRYLFTRRKERFISLISVISILGIAIGVMALIVVLAVMTGFDRDLHDKIIGNYSHISIARYDGIKAGEYESLIARIAPVAHVAGISPYALGQVLTRADGKFFPLTLKGIEPYTEPQVTKIDRYMVEGNVDLLASEPDAVIIGRELAAYLGAGTGSTLTVYSARGIERRLKVAGIFYSRMYDYDMNFVFTSLKSAQEILGLPDTITTIAVKLDNVYAAAAVKDQLSRALGSEYAVKTWVEINPNFFAALKLEKITMFIILTLIILVASFNISSTLIVMVVEKTKDIGTLKAIGMSGAGIRKIFTWAGLLMGVFGTALGAAGGLGLCALLDKYQFVKLPQDIYYIDSLPVSLQLWPDIALIIAAALAITLVSTLYPASRASGVQPVEALRYE